MAFFEEVFVKTGSLEFTFGEAISGVDGVDGFEAALPCLRENVGTALRAGGNILGFGAENFGGEGGGMRDDGVTAFALGVEGTLLFKLDDINAGVGLAIGSTFDT